MITESLDISLIYRKLQRHLNNQAIAFPKTSDGSDLRLLKEHFTPEHAEMALNLSFRFQTAEEIISKMKTVHLSKNYIIKILDSMAEKNCIYKRKRSNGIVYALAPFIVGLYELKAGQLTPEYVKLVDEYTNHSIFQLSYLSTNLSQIRTIPVEESVTPEHPIATYNEVRSLVVEDEGPFLMMDCICRKKRDMLNEPCERTDRRELCLAIGGFASQLLEAGLGRQVSKKEAVEILNQNQKDGLVLQPSGSQDTEFICSCCGCCCGMLRTHKRLPYPAEHWTHDYHAEINMEICIGCGICEKRCNVNAVRIIQQKAIVDLTRCIGCGLCVVTCNQEAVKLVPIKNPKNIPKTYDELYESIYQNKKGWFQKILAGIRMKRGKRWHRD